MPIENHNFFERGGPIEPPFVFIKLPASLSFITGFIIFET